MTAAPSLSHTFSFVWFNSALDHDIVNLITYAKIQMTLLVSCNYTGGLKTWRRLKTYLLFGKTFPHASSTSKEKLSFVTSSLDDITYITRRKFKVLCVNLVAGVWSSVSLPSWHKRKKFHNRCTKWNSSKKMLKLKNGSSLWITQSIPFLQFIVR